jgi:hypothetical protein
MKKLTVLLMLSGILVSCQKEILDTDSGNPDNGNPGNGGSTTGLLVKTVSVEDNTDTLTTIYTYDNQKRLETETMDGASAGMVIHNYKKFERDANGRIKRILQYAVQDGVASDTSINLVHYPNGSSFDYDYTLMNVSVSGFSVNDSAAYSYSGGKMMSITDYLSSPLLGPIAMQTSKFEFTYDGSGRVGSNKMYSSGGAPGTPLTATFNQVYSYGTAINGVYATNNGAQNYLLGGMPNTSNEVMTKLQMQDLTGANPDVNAIVTMTYVLSGNKPTSMVATTAGAQPSVTKASFYYQ